MEQEDKFLENRRAGSEERRTKEGTELRATIDNLESVIAESKKKLETEDNPSLKHLVEKAEESLERLKENLRKYNESAAEEAFDRR